nr:hypothetical protein [Actinidia tombus-like virus]
MNTVIAMEDGKPTIVHGLTSMKTWINGKDKHRSLIQVNDLSKFNRPAMHANSLVNAERALKERVFAVKKGDTFASPVQPLDGIFDTRLSAYRKRLVSLIPNRPSLTLEEFPGRYREARKRGIYENAVSKLCVKPLSSSDYKIKGFIKDDKLDQNVKGDPVPRAILASDPTVNVGVGCIIAHREHDVFEAIDKMFGARTVMKGANAVVRGQIIEEAWSEFKQPVAVAADFAKFDAHVSYDAVEFEHSVIGSMAHGPYERKIMEEAKEHALSGRGTMVCVDGKVSFRRLGGRYSGCMWTSLGNVILACLMLKEYLDTTGIHYRLINDGDDCVILCEKSDFHKLGSMHQHLEEYGFDMVIENPVEEIERIDFCQSRPVFIDGSYIMCRNPHTALVKDTYCTNRPSNAADYYSWVRSVGECGLSLTGGMPMFQEFYQCYVRNSDGRRINKGFRADGGLKLASQGMHRKYQPVSDDTRFSFWRAFGIDSDTQRYMEDEYRRKCFSYSAPVESSGLHSDYYF